jgi:rare lipoprotein A
MRANQLLSIGLGLLLAACASQPRPQIASPKPPSQPGAPKPSVPGVKIGNPYEVFGVRYVPEDDRSYHREGIASWYGPTFHAKPTANGEIYNQEDVTAAHKTLPMPSWVEVHNLDNGRKLVVRINDRGPFVDGRIIDLSKRSAEILGVDRPGLARVRVKRVYPEGDWARDTPAKPLPPVQIASAAATPPASAAGDFTGGPLNTPAVTTVDLPPSPSAAPAYSTPAYPALANAAPANAAQAYAAPSGRFIQVAALSDEGRARALASVLSDFGPASAQPSPGGLWRVRIGPLTEAQAGNMLYDVQAAGYHDARLVK